MPTRLLKESICTSRDINALSPEEEVFFYRIIVNCDDYGYLEADPSILRSRCFPRRINEVTDDLICKWLRMLVDRGLVVVFRDDGGLYLRLPSWEKHQQVRAKWRRYPELTDKSTVLQTSEIICKQMISIDNKCPRNPIQSNPNPIQSRSKPRICAAGDGFSRFWVAYPKKRSKGRAEIAFSKVNPDEQLLATMLAKIEQAKTSVMWTKEDGRFIPHPATWLHDKGWEDEIPAEIRAEDSWPVR